MPVRVSEHKTPRHSDDKMLRLTYRALYNMYGGLVRTCGYCGEPHMDAYVCHCGYQKGYLEDEDGNTVREDGKLVEVWEKG